ncbi:MAG: pyrimidine-nucleoside phosphorylase [Clostridia bacterium]|nr:pyrimidine-nucleoside phosphorylase [Clostridia bacterium]
MRVYDIIKKKRDGNTLSKEEIDFFINGYVKGDIPDYQASALCMAIYFKGMTLEETTDLTLAIRNSGEVLDFSAVNGIRADKHSTGGVGDKTSLVVAPTVASLGVKVAKMSGRGLGHTGGTVDKLEAIPNFNVQLPKDEFIGIVNEVGVCIVGQSADLAPADKKLYALRDVTATVDSMPLIASSIMGKKLAADDDVIVLDVKTGSGSFMKSVQDSKTLAEIMVGIGKRAGKKTVALITDMDIPLGRAIGNALEVKEAIDTLKGKGEKDFLEVCIALATEMLYLSGKDDKNRCEMLVKDALISGKALKTFKAMISAQGGNAEVIEDFSLLPTAKYTHSVKATASGYIDKVNTEGYGLSALSLGAGRNRVGDNIDYSAGIILNKKTGDWVNKGDVIAVLHANNSSLFKNAEEIFLSATQISEQKPMLRPLILDRVE